MADPSERKGLSKIQFQLAFHTYIGHTFIGKQIARIDPATDEEGDLLPGIVGAICLMVRSVVQTEYWDPKDIMSYRRMLEFLDPYLVPPYRPESNELPVTLHRPQYF